MKIKLNITEQGLKKTDWVKKEIFIDGILVGTLKRKTINISTKGCYYSNSKKSVFVLEFDKTAIEENFGKLDTNRSIELEKNPNNGLILTFIQERLINLKNK